VFALHSLYLHHQEYRVHAGERTFTLDATIVAFCCFRDDRSMIMIIFGRVCKNPMCGDFQIIFLETPHCKGR